MATVEATAAQQALDRLAADAKMPDGLSAWCDKHRPDVELVIRELGVPELSRVIRMQKETLYSWAYRRSIPPAPQPHGYARGRGGPVGAHDRVPPPSSGELSTDYYRGLAEGLPKGFWRRFL